MVMNKCLFLLFLKLFRLDVWKEIQIQKRFIPKLKKKNNNKISILYLKIFFKCFAIFALQFFFLNSFTAFLDKVKTIQKWLITSINRYQKEKQEKCLTSQTIKTCINRRTILFFFYLPYGKNP